MSKKIEEARIKLEEWLSHPNELGKKPKKIEYTNYFMDEEGIECYIFRFKETLFGKWILAIVSDSGTFSEMKEYKKQNEIEDAFALLHKLKEYWKAQARKQKSFQELFSKNLKFISQSEIDVETIERQFVKSESRYYLTVGYVDCPSGKIAVADPLAYMGIPQYTTVLDKSIPAGTYPVEVSIYRSDILSIRMCSAKLKVNANKPIKYVQAKFDNKYGGFRDKNNQLIPGFGVDAGMVSFCDVEVVKEYDSFLEKWHNEHPYGNHYDDYFASFFKESEEKLPAYQRSGGDFIEWAIPKSGHRLVMIASGFGDGFYQCYYGYDEKDEICEILVPMVNPDLFE